MPPFGAPNIVPDMKKTGDDLMWQEAEYYLANKDDHTMMFSRASLNRVVTFLYAKANEARETKNEKHTGWLVRIRAFFGNRHT